MDLVSTVIPVFNRPDMLVEAVGSVLAQTYRPVEVIVVDDGSTDNTGRIADELAATHAEVRVIHQQNGGVGRAREAGRQLVRGAFVQYLDSDDVLLPRKFELQIAGLNAHPECGASYGWTRIRTAGQIEPNPAKRTGTEIATLFPSMLQSRWWHTPTPLWRRALVDAAGPWLAQNNEEDWEHDARMAALGVKLHYVADWICEVRRHEAPSVSAEPLAPRVLRDRARAHSLILDHALRAGIRPDAPEMRHFARELFLLARQCGAAGLPAESHMLFDRAREASGADANRLQFRAYAAVARLLGWSNTGRLACLSDRLRW
jgi:glycosyltransferase involved in cell wall biosynthesis